MIMQCDMCGEKIGMLHTLGKEYLTEDITEFVREKGVTV